MPQNRCVHAASFLNLRIGRYLNNNDVCCVLGIICSHPPSSLQTMKLSPEMLAEDIHLLTEFMSNRNWRPATVFHKLNGVQLFLKTITLIADWPAYTGKYVWLHDKLKAGRFFVR